MIEDDELINLDSNTLRFIPKSQLMGNYTIGTFSLVKGKAYESCIILKNTGDSTIKIDSIEANDILLNGVDISKYISLELSTKKYSPEQIDNVMQAGESREIKLYFTVSSELPEEYVNLLVDNVSINVELSEVK